MVPLEAVEDLRRVAPAARAPGEEIYLLGVVQKTDVVQFQSRAAVGSSGLKDPVSVELPQGYRSPRAVQPGGGGVNAQVVRVGPLEKVLERALRTGDGFPAAAYLAPDHVRSELPGPVLPAVHQVDTTGVSVVVQEGQFRRLEVTVDAGHHYPNGTLAVVKVLLHPADVVAREGFHLFFRLPVPVDHRSEFPLGEAGQQPKGEPALGLAAHFGRPEDGGVLRLAHETPRSGIFEQKAARRAADAAAVEQEVAVVRPAGFRLGQAVIEDVAAFHEKGALLAEEYLEPIQIDGSGVGFDLPEIGIYGEVHHDVVGDADATVQARAEAGVGRTVEGVVLGEISARAELAEHVGLNLQGAAGLNAVQAFQGAEAAYPAGLSLLDGRPGTGLLLAEEVAVYLQAPGLVFFLAEAELRKGNTRFGGVALVVDLRLEEPKGVPAVVPVVAVVTDKFITAYAAGGGGERKAGAFVVETVEIDLNPVAGKIIAAAEPRLDLVRVGIEGAPSDVEVAIVVEDLKGGFLAHRVDVAGLALVEAGTPFHLLPGRVVERAVDGGGITLDAGGGVFGGRTLGL